MATGACGIDCTTCRLHLRGECRSCGPAMGQLAELKVQTQERLLGSPCPLTERFGNSSAGVLPAAITVLFDSSIEKYLPADAIWAMVSLVREMMLE